MFYGHTLAREDLIHHLEHVTQISTDTCSDVSDDAFVVTRRQATLKAAQRKDQ